MKNGIWSNIQKFFPFIGLATILIVFSFLSGGRLWQLQNLQSVLNTMIPICLGGGGMIFVSAQGSTNMSMGSTLALSGAIAGLVSNAVGFWSFVPTALLVGQCGRQLQRRVVSKFKVSSLMVTRSMLSPARSGDAAHQRPAHLRGFRHPQLQHHAREAPHLPRRDGHPLVHVRAYQARPLLPLHGRK